VIYGLLFDVAAETLCTIAADSKHLGASIGATLVLHTWGSALTHHPHVHGIVPGGGLSPDGERWIACRPGFFLSVRVLSRLFRRRFLEARGGPPARAAAVLRRARCAGRRQRRPMARAASPVRGVVYAKRPSPTQAVLAICLAIPNGSRLPTAASSPSTSMASPSAGRT
jgi:hypothetical protein